MKTIYYIIKEQNGKYKPFVAKVVPDDDSSLFVIASGEPSDELKTVQKFLKDNTKISDKVFWNPINSNISGLFWLSELEEANPMDNTIRFTVQEILALPDNSITDVETIRQIGLVHNRMPDVSKDDLHKMYRKIQNGLEFCALYPEVMSSFNIKPD